MTSRGVPDALLEVLEVGRQVGAAALLAGLDEDEHAATAAARRQQTRHGGERRVAVVGGAPAVEEVALADRLVGPEPARATRRAAAACPCGRSTTMGSPVPPLSISSTGVRPGSSTISASQRGVLVRDPRPQELGGRGDGAPLGPVRVEGGGEARDAGVLAEGGEDPLLPGGVDAITAASRAPALGDLGQPLERLGHGRRRSCWPTLSCFEEERLLVLRRCPSARSPWCRRRPARARSARCARRRSGPSGPASTVCQAMRRSCSNSITVLDME